MKRPALDPVQAALYAGLTLLAALTLLPAGVMVLLSGKDLAQVTLHFWSLPHPLRWENYLFAAQATGRYIGNSLLVSLAVCALTLAVAAPAAHALTRWEFRGKRLLLWAAFAFLMVPGVLQLVPLYLTVRDLGLLNGYAGLILPQAATSLPIALYLLHAFFSRLPKDLFEAARIDGAGELQVLWIIVVPLSLPVFSTIAILNLLGTWNNYVWALLCVQDASLRTIPLGLAFLEYEKFLKFEPGKLLASYLVASLPLVAFFLVSMRTFMRSLTDGALKG